MKAQQVVIVDDALLNLRILASIVGEIENVSVETFSTSLAALRWCETNDVDCFILDYHMPAPDGLEMIELLRSKPRFALVPIVIITAERERSIRIAALQAGANDFLERPIARDEVLARLRTLLALQSARGTLAQHVGDLEQSLHDEERLARIQAARLVSLWRVANDALMSETEALHAILAAGTEALRSGQEFDGCLLRRDGEDVVIEATTRRLRRPRNELRKTQAGSRFALAGCAELLAFESGKTQLWDDVLSDAAARARTGSLRADVRALIVTPFSVAQTAYCLTFWSSAPSREPFTSDDATYVELLANHFANRMQHAWQSSRIQYQVSHDALTGLRNRTQFRLEASADARVEVRHAVAIVSLDGFRRINDAYGHVAGDNLLRAVGAALERTASATDIVARLTGDTFGLFLNVVASQAELLARIGSFAALFEEAFSTGDARGTESVPLQATIGVAASGPDSTIEELMSRAETAVFVCKDERRGRVLLYETGMESQAQSATRLTGEIALALKRGEFELFLQPHVDLHTNSAVSAEALIRWNHPERGLVMPDAFIGVAERNGMIRAITLWVMVEAIRIAGALHVQYPGFRVYFNVSAYDVRDMSLVDIMKNAANNGARLETVGIEITETGAMQDVGMTARIVREMQQLGVLVALDDFGTGYSSLSMLKRLPLDLLKIDRAFIRDILVDEQDAALAETVVAVGLRLGLPTLAEGVESQEQLAWLSKRGCRFAQGHAITPPLPFERFRSWLAAYGPNDVSIASGL